MGRATRLWEPVGAVRPSGSEVRSGVRGNVSVIFDLAEIHAALRWPSCRMIGGS